MYRALLPSQVPPYCTPSCGSSEASDLHTDNLSHSSRMVPLNSPVSTPKKNNRTSIPGPTLNGLLSTSNLQQKFVHDHITTATEQTAIRLLQKHDHFAKNVPVGGDDEQCNAVNRSAVLGIYNEAMARLVDFPTKHEQIASECSLKVRIVLALLTADPDHPAFSSVGQLLSPLEPQYANPRIEADEDEYGHRAQRRLNKWRGEGWPKKYPEKAIKREMRHERLVGRKAISDKELMEKFCDEEGIWDEEMFKRKSIAADGYGMRDGRGKKWKEGTRQSGRLRARRSDSWQIDVEVDEVEFDDEAASWEDSEEEYDSINGDDWT
jgi:hypothetical protein